LEKLRRYRPSSNHQGSTGNLCHGSVQEASQVCMQVDSSAEEHLVISQIHQGGTDGRNSLRRIHESCEPLDLTEVQGRYCKVFQEVQSSGGAEPLIQATRAVGFTRESCIGVSWVEE
jgi:hypothetical protein